MLLRKRVWDIMREDFAFVREDSSLADAITALRAIRVKQPDMSFVLVFSKSEKFLGILSMWNLIQGMGPCLLKGSVLEATRLTGTAPLQAPAAAALRSASSIACSTTSRPSSPMTRWPGS
jgi:CBS domain.